MLTILHLSRFYLPHVGGTELYIHALVNHTDPALKHRVFVTSRYDKDLGPSPTVPVRRVKAWGPDRFPIIPLGALQLFLELRHADVLHIHDVRILPIAAVISARVQRKPIVLSTHGLIRHTNRYSFLKRIYERLHMRLLIHASARVLASSNRDADELATITQSSALQTWVNPVDLTPFIGLNHCTKQAEEGYCLTYFGRLDTNKGIEHLLDVVGRNSDFSLHIAGRGKDVFVSRLMAASADFSPRVTFHGYLPPLELRELLEQTDVIALPSETEGFGLALVEAMASGVPVVASDIPPFREIARGSDVILCDFTDAVAVARSVNSAAALPRPSLANTRRASEFSWASKGAELSTVYFEVGG